VQVQPTAVVVDDADIQASIFATQSAIEAEQEAQRYNPIEEVKVFVNKLV